jgi:dihydroorotate dehydrogenase electron transfer subunit
MSLDSKLFYYIARTHKYWGRKPLYSIEKIFSDVKQGDVVIDPFCGGGSAVIVALSKGARVLASDINPMAVFLTKVLIRPISIHALQNSYEKVRSIVEKRISEKYTITCPKCKKLVYFDYLNWKSSNGESRPEKVKLTCQECSFSDFLVLSKQEIERQKKISEQETELWFPKDKIESYRKTNVNFYYELFTKRNLSALAELNNAIEQVETEECRDFLHYVFTGMLFSCSMMQMSSDVYPSSSRGWAAHRYYIPPNRREKNVWMSFNARFKNVIECKIKLNSILPNVKIAESLESFYKNDKDVFVYQSDFQKINLSHNKLIKHIYIDPPYIEDIDYIGFSKFWGFWLHMKFDQTIGLYQNKTACSEITEELFKLLSRIRTEIPHSPQISIAYGAKTEQAWRSLYEAIINAGYEIDENKFTPILLNNTQKREGSSLQFDSYVTIKKHNRVLKSKKRINDIIDRLIETTSPVPSTKPKHQILEQIYDEHSDMNHIEETLITKYIRYAICLYEIKDNVDMVRTAIDKLIPRHLWPKFRDIDADFIKRFFVKEQNNLNFTAYHALCFDILNVILKNDNLNITHADNSLFCKFLELKEFPQPEGIFEGAAFVAKNDNIKVAFCFDDQNKKILKKISNEIHSQDKQEFKFICVMIVRRYKEMINLRACAKANQWPRGFFICFDEIIKKAREINSESVDQITSYVPEDQSKDVTGSKVREFSAKVDKHIPVGSTKKNADHFILVLKTPELMGITPGQFVMLDTLKNRISNGETNTTSFDGIIESELKERILSRSSFLKRPFSIHRASYKHFNVGYLKTLSLPPTMASITHTVFPHKFEIFYKVLEEGLGTKELKKITKGSSIHMLGPLGKKIPLSELREKGIEEIHLIGGGVGMAPLIYLGQALKYYSFKIKAFIGIDSYDNLIYRDYHAHSMGEGPKEASIYIDDLENIGLMQDDIYVSNEKQATSDKINPDHQYSGFVTHQYEEYLKNLKGTKNILAFSCGPIPMMKHLYKITKESKIPLRVLLEKRMACGIGVCLSCVCKKKDSGNEGYKYVRVCMDGPLFNADDIVWD